MGPSPIQARTERIEALRTELRSWLTEELPDAWRDTGRGTSEEEAVEIRRDWGRRLAEGAWAAPTWPVEIGGRDLPLEGELAIIEELVDAGAPEALNSNGIGIFGEVLRRHGTDAQRRRHLAPMLDHSKIWCQAFSEPNAGSDLASLQTRGIRDGDRLVVNGQKVWTSFARHADYAYALVRSDPGGPKHAGISLVVIEMAHPGVTVRPLRTLVGGWEFAEVFFTDVEVPLDEVVGGLNQGWPIAVEALALERGRSFAERSLKLRREVVNLAALYERLGRSADGVPAEVVSSYLDSRRLRSLVTRVLRVLEKGEDATALAALAKLHWSEAHQSLLAAAVEGLEAGVLEPEQSEWLRAFLYSRGETIYAGSSEVQRNALARFIGLPASHGGGASAARPRLRGVGAGDVPSDTRLLCEGLQELLAAELTTQRRTVALEGAGFEPEVWRALGTAGWISLACEGNVPGGARTLIALAECVGARLVPGPLGLTITITAPLLARHGDAVNTQALIDGELLTALVMPDGGDASAPRFTAINATRSGGAIRLNGSAAGVRFALQADRLIIPFELDGGVAVGAIAPDRPGLAISEPYAVDLTAPRSRLTFDSVEIGPSELVGGPNADHRDAFATGLRHYMSWLDGEAIGGAEQVLSRTIEYVGQRRQFGVPVGSFQAMKHSLADAYAELELARGHAYDAASAADRDAVDAGAALAASRLICGRMYTAVVERSIQGHGGVGFTWEHELHLWYRDAIAARHDPFPTRVLRHCAATAIEREADAARAGAHV